MFRANSSVRHLIRDNKHLIVRKQEVNSLLTHAHNTQRPMNAAASAPLAVG
jgi:hypothetical protein